MSKPVSSNNHRGAKGIRCAIYTRKSSEEGLEQDFNSLDAQRESCEAYIKSQKHEGWTVIAAPYDDGGLSGATMERPALRRLLDDTRAGKVDVVVVYKVDRLTRALADFSKIVETFDSHNVSFVSVTQQFNTTTSMGRLTLNVLLSFAQFEREVTGERIRDKIAASKKKGMWMGGMVPLGYDAIDRKLVINPGEAKTVRHIFERYVALGSVRALKQELDMEGVVSKVRHYTNGRHAGGVPLARGALYLMLQNRIYLGEIVHKDKSYPGEHDGIIDHDLWNAVQAKLSANRFDHKTGGPAKEPSLLAGLLFDGLGHRLTPSHANKNGKRYRYYVSRPLTTNSRANAPDARRIPAGDIEGLVTNRIRGFFADRAEVFGVISGRVQNIAEQGKLFGQAADLAERWGDLVSVEVRSILLALVSRVEVHEEKVDITINTRLIADVLRSDLIDLSDISGRGRKKEHLTLSVPARLKRAGLGIKMIIDGSVGAGGEGKADPSLVKLIVKSHMFRERLIRNGGSSLGKIAVHQGVTPSYFTRLLRLTFLAPDITKAILEGRHPPTLTAAKLTKASRLPLTWPEQREVLGFN
ncbi:MAG: recombinase family protein [Proteobacteria bacterium]|nr:recombinase family protein [Pseudomonadota bacterium]